MPTQGEESVSKEKKERRDDRRYSASVTVFFVAGTESGCAYTRNLSRTGAFLETQSDLERGTALDIEIFLDLGDEVVSMSAKAVVAAAHHPRRGLGIRFVSMDEASKEMLQRAIARLHAGT